MNRRQVLASLPLALGVPGCLDSPGSAGRTTDDEPATNRTTATTSAVTSRAPEPSDSPAGSTTGDGPAETTGTTDDDVKIPPNDTPYPAVVQWNLPDAALDGEVGHDLALLTGDDWRQQVGADALAPAVRQFVDETAFGRQAVLALAAPLDAADRSLLVAQSVDHVGDAIPHLRVDASHGGIDPTSRAGPGSTDPPRHLLAVRIPTRGRVPTAALASVRYSVDHVTMAADPSPPPVNGTPYEVAWSDRAGGWTGTDPDSPPVELVTGEGWRERLVVDEIPENVRALLSETAFSTASVVLLGTLLPVCDNRPVLRAVSGLGTARPELHVVEYDPYCPQNALTDHLLAVRLPNRGTTPDGAVVSYSAGGETYPIRTGD